MQKEIANHTKMVEKYRPQKGTHTAYAKESSKAMPSTNVRTALYTARKCKDEAIRTSDAAWGAIHRHHPDVEIPELRIDPNSG